MRYALGIEYDGKNYCGWQRQINVMTVQEKLEQALSKIANETIEVVCAGRTDTGVNATNQVIHFDTTSVRKVVGWTLGVNTHLPEDIAVTWCKQVDDEFHARFSATARRYRYIIYNGQFRPGILRNGLSHYHVPLNVELMHQAGQYIIGEQDFTSFRALHCQANSPVRNIEYLNITRRSDFIVVDIKANAFLHHMVRNIVGSLIEVGRGNQPIDWLKKLLLVKDRSKAAATAKPGGLYLVEVDYPNEFALPTVSCGPLFLDIV